MNNAAATPANLSPEQVAELRTKLAGEIVATSADLQRLVERDRVAEEQSVEIRSKINQRMDDRRDVGGAL